MRILFFYIPFPDENSLNSTTQQLLEEKLVACGNYFPATSNYFWKGEFQSDQEWIGIFKTRIELAHEVRKRVDSLHPYDVPCMISWEAEVNESYGKWVCEQTNI